MEIFGNPIVKGQNGLQIAILLSLELDSTHQLEDRTASSRLRVFALKIPSSNARSEQNRKLHFGLFFWLALSRGAECATIVVDLQTLVG